VRYERLDLTTLEGPAMIAHGVNLQNRMGSGVARALYQKWPEVKRRYHARFRGAVRPELGWVEFIQVAPGLTVANCFTQEFFGNDGAVYANAKAIDEALWRVACCTSRNLEIHMPKIGCGLGGLDWERDVKPVVLGIEAPFGMTRFVVCEFW
jgi:O-acetyl-ADP-ribose deacetylase (regulator of RNase III)